MARPKRQAAQRAKLKLSYALTEEDRASAEAHASPGSSHGDHEAMVPDSVMYAEEPEVESDQEFSMSDSDREVKQQRIKTTKTISVKEPKTPKIRTKPGLKHKVAAPSDDSSKRFGRRRHANGGKEDNIISLLGNHVSMSEALTKKQEWAVEVLGPRLTLMRKYFGDVHSLPMTSDFSSDPQKSTPLGAVPPMVGRHSIRTQFVKPEDRTLIYREMSRHDIHDSFSSGSKSESITICTGLVNHTVAWLPTSVGIQYLAVAGKDKEQEPLPLFQVQGGPGQIQIWQIASDGQRKVRLRKTICHNYGVSWQLKWCPALSHSKALGLLAGVFGDGSLRLFNVYDELDGHAIEQLDHAAHTFNLPDSHVVTFDWLDHTRIAAGCANGMFVVWDIAGDMRYPISTGILHSTFVNNIVACGPTASDVVLTTSWDCSVKMSNIWNPEVEFVAAARERTSVYAAAWSDFINCAIVNDDLRSFRIVSMRGGFSATLGSMEGTVTALATNEKHPFLAVGDASGAVTIVNVCRKAMMKKLDQFRRRVYQLDYGMKEDEYRFTENFYIDELLSKTVTAKNVATKIYPQEVKVTALAWNGNPGFEGLLASATTHFVRIDNVGV